MIPIGIVPSKPGEMRVARVSAGAVLVSMLLVGAAPAAAGWREIRAPHVVLRTNLESAAAKEAALTVERIREGPPAMAAPTEVGH